MPKKSTMQTIDPASFAHFPSRIQYLRDFIQFTHEDAAILHSAKDVIAPLIPLVVDAVYTTLLSFDITAKTFVPQQTGYKKEPPTRLEDLHHEHPHIKFRKDLLARYLVKLVTMDYEKDESWEYLDKVAVAHVAGFAHRAKKPELRIEYMHCAIMLGYVQDIVVNAVLTHDELDRETKIAIVRALNKLIWIQNDIFARHYIRDDLEGTQVTLQKSTAVVAAVGFVALGLTLARYVIPHLRK
ncbi:hypothetical protein Hypma_007171 [Hypsizygus marmoreus]|uniref:Globin-sensor domain-containing protein n=1 Tax=Hypsizygus marmoreus TaxID=39966 RepID=A0A369KET6_HYPMA|nr:hypothetical protein Hypma_007171 [Hypsizygus marmoreus]